MQIVESESFHENANYMLILFPSDLIRPMPPHEVRPLVSFKEPPPRLDGTRESLAMYWGDASVVIYTDGVSIIILKVRGVVGTTYAGGKLCQLTRR